MPPSSDGGKSVDMLDTSSPSAQLTEYVQSQREAKPLDLLHPLIQCKPVMQIPVDARVDDCNARINNDVIMGIQARRHQERVQFGGMDPCEGDVDVQDLTPECPGLTAIQIESLQKYNAVRIELAEASCDDTGTDTGYLDGVAYPMPTHHELWLNFLGMLGPARFFDAEECTPVQGSDGERDMPRRRHWTSVKTKPLPASKDDAVSSGILSREEIAHRLSLIEIPLFLAVIKRDMDCLLCNFNDQVHTMLEFNDQAVDNLWDLRDCGKEISEFLSKVIKSADNYLGPVSKYPQEQGDLNTVISQMQDMVTEYNKKTMHEKGKVLANLARDLNEINACEQTITCDNLTRLFGLRVYELRVLDPELIDHESQMYDFELQQTRIEGNKHWAQHDPSSDQEFELPALESRFTQACTLVNCRMIKILHDVKGLDYEDSSEDGIESMRIFLEDLMQLLYDDEMEYLKMFLNHLTLSVANTRQRITVFDTVKDTAHVLMSMFSTEETASRTLDGLREGLLTQQQFAEKIQQATKDSFVEYSDDAWHELIRILLRNLEIVESTLPKSLIQECLTSLKIAQDSAQADRQVQRTQEEMMLPAPALHVATWTSNEGTSARGGTSGRGRGRKPQEKTRSSQRQNTTASRTPTAQGAPSTVDQRTSARGNSSGRGQKRKAMSAESSSTAPVEMSAEQEQVKRTLSGRRTRRPERFSSS